MRIDLETRTVVLERKPCTHCYGRGSVATMKYKPCTKCKPTTPGKRGSGRCHACNDPNGYYPRVSKTTPHPDDPTKLVTTMVTTRRPGFIMYYDQEDRTTCSTCDGSPLNHTPEGYTDSVDASRAIPITIERTQRQQSWYEQYIGAGVYTVVDYGRHRDQSDEEIIATVREALERVQACKIVRSKDDLRLADEIRIVTAASGYSAVPVFNKDPAFNS